MIPAQVTSTSSRPLSAASGHRRLDVGTRGHVAADRAPADPLRGLRCGGLVEVGDDDVRALGGEALRGRGADPLRAARDERRPALEAAHRIILTTSSATQTGLSPPSRSTVAEHDALLAAGDLLDRLHREPRADARARGHRRREAAPC